MTMGVLGVTLLAGCVPSPREPAQNAPGDAQRGARLITQYQCGSCHAIPGIAAARGRTGPDLESFGRRAYIAGRIANRPESLAQWLQKPHALVPSTTMPDMGVPPADARDMAAWLTELR